MIAITNTSTTSRRRLRRRSVRRTTRGADIPAPTCSLPCRRDFRRYWVGAYVRYDVLSGATFEDSPLVRQKSYVAGGFGIAWMIGKSKRMVKAED